MDIFLGTPCRINYSKSFSWR